MTLHTLLQKVSRQRNDSNPKSIIGKAILASAAKHLKDGGGIEKHLVPKLKHHLTPHHGKLSVEEVNGFYKKHKNKTIHVKDILGGEWQRHKDKFINELHKHVPSLQDSDSDSEDEKGANTGSGRKHHHHKIGRVLKRFFKGETKFKPSHLVSLLGKAVSAAGAASAVIPGVDLISAPAAGAISAGLEYGSSMLKKSGRGVDSYNYGKGLTLAGSRKCSCGRGVGKGLTLAGSHGGGGAGKCRMRGGKMVGTKSEVFDPSQPHQVTIGGLTVSDLMKNKRGKIVSKKRHAMGMKLHGKS